MAKQLGISWAGSLKNIKKSAKLCIIGEGGVGKTSILRVLTQGLTPLKNLDEMDDIVRTPYINIDVFSTEDNYKIQVYDLSGQRFSAHPIHILKNQVLLNLDAILFVFAVNNFNSLINLTQWFNDVINFMNDNKIPVPPFFLVGNKCDLDSREIPAQIPQKIIAQRPQFKKYIEISAYSGENISELVELIESSIKKVKPSH